ncbi:MAG TPA: D-alanine--D-alanine ligase [Segeticoccus sp.]|uniref:D-alanine--D-alanine ligase family protein n=1 Tax=Segeticoccus sp. TaxID=2706531 RepID=UPI002D7E807B|nr:D-alanine--D-alanine ligase [Segeticoccus sp.]HET8600883.1 D-alanine--D-alanine ligase [Segeticoccus sp.]
MTHVLILAGGLSHERDVSLRSGRRVADVLAKVDVEAHVADADGSLLERLAQTEPDVVWPVLHGASGEDGAIRDVLGSLGFRYVGSTPESCRLTWDKPVAKTLVQRAGVRTPRGVALPHDTFRELGAGAVLDAISSSLTLPLVVKPARGGSALGLSVVHNAAQLPAAMVDAYAYGDIALLESFVEGTEVAVTVLEGEEGAPVALPAVEIVPDGGVYTYAARYTAGETEFFTPARLADEVSRAVAHAAITAYRALGHRHLSRIDLIVDPAGVPWFLEGNVAPGMTETSLVPMAVAASGREAGAVYHQLLTRALVDSER